MIIVLSNSSLSFSLVCFCIFRKIALFYSNLSRPAETFLPFELSQNKMLMQSRNYLFSNNFLFKSWVELRLVFGDQIHKIAGCNVTSNPNQLQTVENVIIFRCQTSEQTRMDEETQSLLHNIEFVIPTRRTSQATSAQHFVILLLCVRCDGEKLRENVVMMMIKKFRWILTKFLYIQLDFHPTPPQLYTSLYIYSASRTKWSIEEKPENLEMRKKILRFVTNIMIKNLFCGKVVYVSTKALWAVKKCHCARDSEALPFSAVNI